MSKMLEIARNINTCRAEFKAKVEECQEVIRTFEGTVVMTNEGALIQNDTMYNVIQKLHEDGYSIEELSWASGLPRARIFQIAQPDKRGNIPAEDFYGRMGYTHSFNNESEVLVEQCVDEVDIPKGFVSCYIYEHAESQEVFTVSYKFKYISEEEDNFESYLEDCTVWHYRAECLSFYLIVGKGKINLVDLLRLDRLMADKILCQLEAEEISEKLTNKIRILQEEARMRDITHSTSLDDEELGAMIKKFVSGLSKKEKEKVMSYTNMKKGILQ